ncbi:MAG: hypothetical protein ACH346_04150 [Chthoniobacterales bacterium]
MDLKGWNGCLADRIHEFEPYAVGVAAVRVPQEGIVDYRAVVRKMAEIFISLLR